MDLGLKNRTVLITGGSSGIGLSIVQAFLREGCRIAILDLKPPSHADLLNNEQVKYCSTDLTDHKACENSVENVVTQFGGVDYLINNAGTNDSVSLECSPERFSESLQKNLVHYFTMAHFCLPYLKESSAGAIVNISSKVAETGQGGTSGYAAAKGGINALTREWAVELAPAGIRINTVVPAEVWTTMYENWLGKTDNPVAEKKRIEASIPLYHRFTTPEEIAAMVVFLASAQSSHTTGQIVYVDGGYSHLDRRLQ
ncbi:SDR family oxidoreductase [uncultured Rubinisphaera sp.]|uniref:SDR family oxidoreductase n=1 Tax=uncultured Rubinisphaera sp. TaxID=1678686 RepID=UPI0030DAFC12